MHRSACPLLVEDSRQVARVGAPAPGHDRAAQQNRRRETESRVGLIADAETGARERHQAHPVPSGSASSARATEPRIRRDSSTSRGLVQHEHHGRREGSQDAYAVVVRSPRRRKSRGGPIIEAISNRPDSALHAHSTPRAASSGSAAASASSGTMRDRCVFPDPQKQHAQCPFRAFTTQKRSRTRRTSRTAPGRFLTDVDEKIKRAAVVFVVIRDATRAKRVDDRAQGHAAAVRERGVGWEQGGAQAHACLRKCFGTRDVARRGGESRRGAWRDPGIPNANKKGSRFSRLGSRSASESLGETTRGAGGRARAAREHAPANTTRRARPTPKPSGRPWSARWRLTMRCFSKASLGTIEPPKTGSWCVGINPSVIAPRPCRLPGTRADDAAQTPTGATPHRCARSKCEERISHRSFGHSVVAHKLRVGLAGDGGASRAVERRFGQRGRNRGGERMRHSAPALASFSRRTP